MSTYEQEVETMGSKGEMRIETFPQIRPQMSEFFGGPTGPRNTSLRNPMWSQRGGGHGKVAQDRCGRRA